MIYDLAHYFARKTKDMLYAPFSGGFFKFLLLPFCVLLAAVCLTLSLIFFAASFMTIFEKIAMGWYRFAKAGWDNSSFFPRLVFWLPLVLSAYCICFVVIVLSLGQAFSMASRA